MDISVHEFSIKFQVYISVIHHTCKKVARSTFALCIFALCAIHVSFFSHSADKALLIGIGNYQNDEHNMAGIDIDLLSIYHSLQLFGIEQHNILILKDQDATLKNIEKAFSTFLQAVGKQDNVFIYFSTHGSQVEDNNGDEDDGLDEFLLTYEFDYRQTPFKGMLTDDAINSLVGTIPSDRVFVFVDACHSGTASREFNTRNFNPNKTAANQWRAKFVEYPDMPKAKPTKLAKQHVPTPQNFVMLSASQDDEKAIATPFGSIFTQALHYTIAQTLKTDRDVSIRDLYQSSKQLIALNVGRSDRYSPNLTGKAELFDAPFKLITENKQAYFYSRLKDIAAAFDNVSISSPQQRYKTKELVELSITSTKSGYLTLIYVDKYDVANTMIPNRKSNLIQLEANKNLALEPAMVKFILKAGQPVGPATLFAIVTNKPIDFANHHLIKRNDPDKEATLFTPLSVASLEQVKFQQKSFVIDYLSSSEVEKVSILASGYLELEILDNLE